MQVCPVMSTPDTVRGPTPAFSQVGSTPGMITSCPPASAPTNTSFSQASGATLRPPHSVAGDFTFRPVVSPLPTPEFPAAGSQMGIRGSINPGLPHAPFFSPGNQGFQRPMGQPWMHAPPPHQAGPYPRNQLPAGFHPAIQPGGQMIPPRMPAPSNLSNFSAPQPFQLMPRPQQNPFLNSNRQGDI
jgi:splicing factor 1